jgi:putative ABC transport system substrate-binding protein
VIRRRQFLRAVAYGMLAATTDVRAQPGGRIPVVGFLSLSGPDSLAQFRDAMREFGYVEGRTVTIERRSSDGRTDELPRLATELVQRNVDVIYATGPAALRAAKAATTKIPIVALDLETDPVTTGIVRSLGRPGGNITGLFLDQPILAGKWLELLMEAAPGRRRVGLLWDVTTGDSQLKAAQAAAQRLGAVLHVFEIRTGADLDPALHNALARNVQSIMMLSSPIVSPNSKHLAQFTMKNRLPGISPFRAFAEGGGLLSYGPDLVAFRRFSATYVDKILKGGKPAELPIQQPTNFEFVVNQKTARGLGLDIPPSMLVRADEVIQ